VFSGCKILRVATLYLRYGLAIIMTQEPITTLSCKIIAQCDMKFSKL